MLTAVVVSLAKLASIMSTIAAPRLLDASSLDGIIGLTATASTGLAAVVVPVLFAAALLAKAQRMATADVQVPEPKR
jgi:hypothetical protein